MIKNVPYLASLSDDDRGTIFSALAFTRAPCRVVEPGVATLGQKRTYETPTFRVLLVKGSGLDPLLTGSSTDEALPLCLGIATARPFRRSI